MIIYACSEKDVLLCSSLICGHFFIYNWARTVAGEYVSQHSLFQEGLDSMEGSKYSKGSTSAYSQYFLRSGIVGEVHENCPQL